jgi:hypothetical protein
LNASLSFLVLSQSSSNNKAYLNYSAHLHCQNQLELVEVEEAAVVEIQAQVDLLGYKSDVI